MNVGIKITLENKTNNQLSNAVDTIMIGNYPEVWVNSSGRVFGYKYQISMHEADGWLPYVIPPLGEDQKLGALYHDTVNNVFTNYLVNKTEEELRQEQILNSESNRSTLVFEIQEQKIIESAQEFDDTTALDNKDLYPMFDPNGFVYTVDFKCQDFNINNKLVLYKCIQPITSQAQYPPRLIAAHFKEVAYPGQVPKWVLPQGGEQAYDIGDIVWYPEIDTQKWISKINGNTTVPDEDEPYNRFWEPYNE